MSHMTGGATAAVCASQTTAAAGGEADGTGTHARRRRTAERPDPRDQHSIPDIP